MYYHQTNPQEIKTAELTKDGKGLKITTENKIFYTTIEHLVNLMEVEDFYETQQEREKAYATL